STGSESGSDGEDDDRQDIRTSTDPDIVIVLEPTKNNPWLVKFYADPARYGTVMQAWMLWHRFRTYVLALREAAAAGKVVVLDRCFMTGDRVFVEWNHECGSISDKDYERFSDLREMGCVKLPLPQRVVYLDVDVDVIVERVRSRNRSCEQGIPREYLAGIEAWYKRIEAEHAERGFTWHHEEWAGFAEDRGGSRKVLLEHIRDAPRLDSDAVLAVVGDKVEMGRRADAMHAFYAETVARIGEELPQETVEELALW
ncbi:MAG TPA: deoxynucleoside kinase, partial [Ramlibacter sp.]|nr:deoxynucleoside kinase [Ramlibacter sp.]